MEITSQNSCESTTKSMTVQEFCDRHKACYPGVRLASENNITSMYDAWMLAPHEYFFWIASRPGVLSVEQMKAILDRMRYDQTRTIAKHGYRHIDESHQTKQLVMHLRWIIHYTLDFYNEVLLGGGGVSLTSGASTRGGYLLVEAAQHYAWVRHHITGKLPYDLEPTAIDLEPTAIERHTQAMTWVESVFREYHPNFTP